MPRPLVVFIGGGSASGKTTFTKLLKEALEALGYTVAIVPMDAYYFDRPDSMAVGEYLERYNLDTPEALDLELLAQNLSHLSDGKATDVPKFCFNEAKRKEMYSQSSTEIVLVEGIFALKFMRDHFKSACFSVNISVESYLQLMRQRIARNMRLFKQEEDSVRKYERDKVGAGYFRYTAHYAHCANVDILNAPAPVEAGKIDLSDMQKQAQELAKTVIVEYDALQNAQLPQDVAESSSAVSAAEPTLPCLRSSLFPAVDSARFPINQQQMEEEIEPESKCVL